SCTRHPFVAHFFFFTPTSPTEIYTLSLHDALPISALGGVLGCLLILTLNNLTSGIGSFKTFSETTLQFRVTPAIMGIGMIFAGRSEEHTSELQSRFDLVCRLLLEKKKKKRRNI